MKTLILPIAGKSSRYQGMQPKWAIKHPSGCSMLTESIRGINPKSFDRIVIVCLTEYIDDVISISYEIKQQYNVNVDIMCMKESNSQVETVAYALTSSFDINLVYIEPITGSIFIKDCDGYFGYDMSKVTENSVIVADLHNQGKINAGNKSYVKIGVHNTIGNIAEKKIISNLFCVGGYFFKEASDFIKYHEAHENTENLYISHIIFSMLLDGHRFYALNTQLFIDWGTKEDWFEYLRSQREFRAIVMDVDLTLCEKDLNKPYSELKPKMSIVKKLKEYRKKGFYIILHTGRNMKTYNCNLGQINANTAPTLLVWLNKYDIPYDEIYYGKPWCGKRGFNVCDSTIRPDEFLTLTHSEILKKLTKSRSYSFK